MFPTKFVEEIKTHILYSVTFFENRSVFEIMWKNMIEPDRPQMTIWCMRSACWVTKTTRARARTHTHTHSEYVILIAFPQQQRLQERASVLRLYLHGLSCCEPDARE